jgi:hypothetical protein
MTHPEIYDDGYSLEYIGVEEITDFEGFKQIKVIQRKCEPWMDGDGQCMNYAVWYAKNANLEIVKGYLELTPNWGSFHFFNRCPESGDYIDYSPSVKPRKYFVEETA